MRDFRISTLNDIYGKLLTERQSDILKHYYDYDLSYAEIAEIFSITRQGVGQIIEASIRQLDTLDKALDLCQIISELEKINKEITDENASRRIEQIIARMRSQMD